MLAVEKDPEIRATCYFFSRKFVQRRLPGTARIYTRRIRLGIA